MGFNDGLPAAQPDMVEGLIVPEYDPFPSVTSLVELLSLLQVQMQRLCHIWPESGKGQGGI
jgi:hypothetical protein